MPILRVTDLASVGIVTDVDPTTLPPGAWTAGENVRFSDGGVEKFLGHKSFATPSVAPYYLLPTTKATTLYWVYAGLDNVGLAQCLINQIRENGSRAFEARG